MGSSTARGDVTLASPDPPRNRRSSASTSPAVRSGRRPRRASSINGARAVSTGSRAGVPSKADARSTLKPRACASPAATRSRCDFPTPASPCTMPIRGAPAAASSSQRATSVTSAVRPAVDGVRDAAALTIAAGVVWSMWARGTMAPTATTRRDSSTFRPCRHFDNASMSVAPALVVGKEPVGAFGGSGGLTAVEDRARGRASPTPPAPVGAAVAVRRRGGGGPATTSGRHRGASPRAAPSCG